MEEAGRGALAVMLIYGAVFAALWFAVFALTLGRGIVG